MDHVSSPLGATASAIARVHATLFAPSPKELEAWPARFSHRPATWLWYRNACFMPERKIPLILLYCDVSIQGSFGIFRELFRGMETERICGSQGCEGATASVCGLVDSGLDSFGGRELEIGEL